MIRDSKEQFNIAYALDGYKLRVKCENCGWETRLFILPSSCPICGSRLKEISDNNNI